MHFSFSKPSEASNGAITYAVPATGIVVDGELADWPKNIVKHPLSFTNGSVRLEADNVTTEFMISYDPVAFSIHVALIVQDESHLGAKSSENKFSDIDHAVFILDVVHSQTSSGMMSFQLADGKQGLYVPRPEHNPDHVGISLDDLEFSFVRKDSTSIYEWSIALGTAIYPGNVLGMDIVLYDPDYETRHSGVQWGQQSYKGKIAGRLGDVVLLGLEEKLGKVSGRISSGEDQSMNVPQVVRFTSIKRPSLWVDVLVDDEGRYEVKLPADRYRITSAYRNTQPFEMFNADSLESLDPEVMVSVLVKANESVVAEDLILSTLKAPTHLLPSKGILFGYDPTKIEMVDEYIEAFRRYYDVPGASIALIHEGKVVHVAEYGMSNMSTDQSVTASTLFETASISKSIFAVAVMRLAERGVIDIDKPLHEYLSFKQIASDKRSLKMTARHVLSHQSGLPNWAWNNDPKGWTWGGPIELAFKPGTSFSYSGEAFEYLSRVVAKLTNKKIERVIRDEVLEPLSLKDTFVSATPKIEGRISMGHSHYYPTYFATEKDVWVAGSMYSNARDFGSLISAILTGDILSPEIAKGVFKRHSVVPPEFYEGTHNWDEAYGLGFHLQSSPYGLLIGHGGNNGDFQSRFAMIPEANIGYVIFTNGNSGHRLIQSLEALLITGTNHNN